MYPTQEHVFIPPPPPISTTLSEKFFLFVVAGNGVGEQETRSAQEPRTVRGRTESDINARQLRRTAEAEEWMRKC
ncbi:hypothetical protein F2P79_015426 [Pimephales promelas]|nr:hypothetical protein F2P79_015426 [Pimephales promelas]